MSDSSPSKPAITQLLQQWSEGKREAFDELMPLVYEELHRQAARYLRKENRNHTLQTTALINEAYLKLVDLKKINWASRTHFFAFAANAMRQILVDYARAKLREKRGGELQRAEFDEALAIAVENKDINLITLDAALLKLEKIDARQVRIVELRYFAGLSLEETAEAMKLSRATVAREWNLTRAWLHRELTK